MRFLLLGLLGVSGVAMAHPGHDQFFHSALLAGLLHPFTGLDHLMMGLGLGILMARTFKQVRFFGLGLLLLSLASGFIVGMQHGFAGQFAEYGIVASLLVLSLALWQRSNTVFLAMIACLGVFHGMAHGHELPSDVSPVWFMLGMLTSLAGLYVAGTRIARLFRQHVTLGERATAVLASLIAVLGFA